ncbi:hypothetical protein [Pajaroellobacter abortibovis]|uniref:Uncharacterized protein n=1 Tax=Pajaroellobacter abortibovis TaxID=1882918 RepID=A0A1L6MX59_9BACT|nr:hypothetical protein [Pajaroellobacter abortibovis]APR99997.1 hypothetical protein BCY86_04335 [Pajaroellobacter abortibovis]
MARYLVTGASGFLGAHVVSLLVQRTVSFALTRFRHFFKTFPLDPGSFELVHYYWYADSTRARRVLH